MSNSITFFVFILTFVNSQNVIEEYVIHKDIFNGFKAAEFTVYDRSEKQVHYRLESDYGLTQTINDHRRKKLAD